MDVPKEFFTIQSMLTLTGATGATFIVANGVQRAFNFNPRWLALAIAQLIVMLGTYATGGNPIDYFVGLINGFLVFCTAAGATNAIGGSGAAVARGTPHKAQDAALPQNSGIGRRFLTSWF